MVDTASRKVRRRYAELAERRAGEQDSLFRRLKMTPIRVFTGEGLR